MTAYVPEGEQTPETNHILIAKRYIAGDFWFDFIPWLPVFAFVEDNTRASFWRLFFAVKVMRISKGIQVLDVMALME